jgi:Na+-translocating ferredoxin:NAD+ oxidoreductase RNF subunit RnfB
MEPFRRTVARLAQHSFVVDEDRCFGCAACIALCPVNALDLVDILVFVDEPICTHCKLCIPACPVHALSIKPNEDL